MSFRITTEVTMTARDPELECNAEDLEQVGTHKVEFTCHSDDPVAVHIAALEAFKKDVWISYPDQFDVEVAFPAGATVVPLGRPAVIGTVH